MIYIISCGSIIIFGEEYIEAFSALGSIGGLIIFLPVMGAAMMLPRRAPEAYAASSFKLKGFWLYLVPILGMLLTVVAIAMLLFDLWSKPIGIIFFYLFLGRLAVGMIFYEWRRRVLRKQGREPKTEIIRGQEF